MKTGPKFKSLASAESAFKKKYEQLNGSAIDSEGAPESPGFKSPMAECGVGSHTTQHNTTQHNTTQ